jgi:hypothetical protein
VDEDLKLTLDVTGDCLFFNLDDITDGTDLSDSWVSSKSLVVAKDGKCLLCLDPTSMPIKLVSTGMHVTAATLEPRMACITIRDSLTSSKYL